METRITMEGVVGTEPDLSITKSGKSVAKVRMAHTERVRKEDGTWEDGDTTWYTVTSWGNMAERVAENVHKGDRCLVTGRFRIQEWTQADGTPRTTPEITADTFAVVPRLSPSQGPQRRQSQSYSDESPF